MTRDEAADILCQMSIFGRRNGKAQIAEAINMAIDVLKADAVPVRHGKWLEDPDDDWGVRCSECGHLELYQFDFCAGCGADMRGKQDG